MDLILDQCNFQQPSGTRQVVIPIGREQSKIVYRCLGRAKKQGETRYLTVALFYVCLHYSGNPPTRDVLFMTTPTKPTRRFRYCPHEDQDELITMTLETAKEAIGMEDPGAALTHICAWFLGLHECKK